MTNDFDGPWPVNFGALPPLPEGYRVVQLDSGHYMGEVVHSTLAIRRAAQAPRVPSFYSSTENSAMKSVRTYQRKIAELRNLLACIEWVQPTYNGSPSCPCCGNQKHMGHGWQCALQREIPARYSSK